MQHMEVRSSQPSQMMDVTDRVREIVARSGVRSGVVVIFVPHTTAGVTINENADPDVVQDLLGQWEQTVPAKQPFFRHGEGNSAAHAKASMVGSSVTVPVDEGRVALGTWQGVYVCEFDGPRTRNVLVQVMGQQES